MKIDFDLKTVHLPSASNAWEEEVISFINKYRSNDKIKVQTSGSTGEPKTYYLDKVAMQQSAQLTAAFLNLNKGDTALLCMPVQYIAGKMMIVRALEVGMKLICIEPKVELTIPEKIDFAAMTPMQAEASISELNKIDKLILGGAKVSTTLEEKLSTLSTSIYESYGMTETITHIAMRKLNQEEYFYTLDGIEISQTDYDCLVIQTPYFEESITTNDIVELKDERTFELLGRGDNIINSGGLKINPEKLEGQLKPYISSPFIVHYKKDKVLGQKLVLVVEGTKKEINYPSSLLPKNQNPKEIIFISEFPRTVSGKIRRKDIQL